MERSLLTKKMYGFLKINPETLSCWERNSKLYFENYRERKNEKAI